jgi:hypothetical protein
VLRKLEDLFRKLIDLDTSNKLWLCEWTSQMQKMEKESEVLDYIIFISKELENIRTVRPSIYEDSLRTIKDILLKNKKKYAFEMQLTSLNLNQNYFIAQLLWEKMTTG